MTAPVDLGQFGQWLIAHQDWVFTDLVREQQRPQEDLLKTLCQHLKWAAPVPTEAVSTASRGARPSYSHLTKLTAEDDIEAFLFAFEKTAVMAAWPRSQWVPIQGPYLTGPAQVVLHMMPTSNALNYDQVKDAILDRYEILKKTYRARFQTLCYKARDQP